MSPEGLMLQNILWHPLPTEPEIWDYANVPILLLGELYIDCNGFCKQ